MRLVYRYIGKPSNEEVFEGKLFAENETEAIEKISKQGIKVIEIKLDLATTVNTIFFKSPNGRELSQFYRTIARRLANARGTQQTIEESLEFAMDENLRVMGSMMLLAAKNAATIDDCMRFAQFPERDYTIVKSMRLAGSPYRAFESLSGAYERDYNLKRMIRGVFAEPLFALFLGYLMIWAVFVFAIPKMEHLFKVLPNGKIPKDIQPLYHFVNVFDSHLVISTILYLAILPAIFFFVRSRLFARLIDYVQSIKALSQRSDHAIIWSSYALLYEAAWNRADAAELIARGASRPDSRAALLAMATSMRRAATPVRAVATAGFPPFVRSAVGNILGTGAADDIVEGLLAFSETLQDDVKVLSERVAIFLKNASLVTAGILVLGIIMVTIMPIMLSAISMA